MKNKIDDLRNHLFETIEMLKDRDEPMDIERAKAISGVAGKIIESAKVEVKYCELTGSRGSGFMPDRFDQPDSTNGALPAPAHKNGQRRLPR